MIRRHRHHATMPLSMARPGEIVELVEIRGGHRMRKRLADLGLNIGTKVRVIQGNHGEQKILAVKEDSRLAIGKGMSHKIIVTNPIKRV
jgi:ferrous iron transport protein A